jgi:hypothetical protein
MYSITTIALRSFTKTIFKCDVTEKYKPCRDFADIMKIPRCAACDELIFAAEYTGQS